jgi:hypothetical protein
MMIKVRAAEDARRLTVKRALALDALDLDNERTLRLEKELEGLGLASITGRVKSDDTRDLWDNQDTRALLCLDRHVKGDPKIWASFFSSRGSNSTCLTGKRGRLMKETVLGWEADDDTRLEKLYKFNGRSFQDLVDSTVFGGFTVLELETMYGQILARAEGSMTTEWDNKRGPVKKG